MYKKKLERVHQLVHARNNVVIHLDAQTYIYFALKSNKAQI